MKRWPPGSTATEPAFTSSVRTSSLPRQTPMMSTPSVTVTMWPSSAAAHREWPSACPIVSTVPVRGRVASAANLLANDAPPTAAADANRTAATARRRSRSALQLLDWVAGKPERAHRARRRKSAASAGALPFLELFSKRS